MAAGGITTTSPRWRCISSSGPKLAYHTAGFINGFLYLHGGIDKKGSTAPLNKLYKFEPSEGNWQEITQRNCPSLSHHASVVLEDRYLLTIGGWDGHVRVSDLHAFDTVQNKWISIESSGFPAGAGLSSHTATLLVNGDIQIIGREGSLRMQRRSGNAFILSGSIASGSFRYADCAMGVASRSGHTATILGRTLLILGGRNDKIIEMHSGYRGFHNSPDSLSKIASLVQSLKAMPKPPCGRKHHVAIGTQGALLIHGGETFDGRSRYPVGEMYVLTNRPHIQWFSLGDTGLGRAGHVCCVNGDMVLMHGGEGAKGIIHSETLRLEI